MVAGRMAVAGPDNPLAHGGEGRQVRSEFSCVREDAMDSHLATATGLLLSAEVRGWGSEDENPSGICNFQPSSPPEIRTATCLSVSLLGCYFEHSFIFIVFSTYSILELKCISY